MTSIITFDPPLGAVEHIHGGSRSRSQLFQRPQPPSIDFLFTAQLSAYDYENLILQGAARLQIWTNIPRLEDDDGNDQLWREIDFVDPDALKRELSAYRRVSLQVSREEEPIPRLESSAQDIRTLYLAIPIPAGCSREFSFTYRIVYPSGRTTWLGFYERNGTIIFDADQKLTGPFSSRTIEYTENLSTLGNWSPFSSSGVDGIITNVQSADSMTIAQVKDMAATRIWALGKERLVQHASVLILVPAPRSQSTADVPAHRPSYILSAAPGATLSVASNGGVTVSGSGTVLMTIIDCLDLYSPSTVLEVALQHSDLKSVWTHLASDVRTQTAVLARTGNGLPIPAVVVSFNPLGSNFTSGPTLVPVETSGLVSLFNTSGATGKQVKEFSIVSSSRSAMYVFGTEEEMARPGPIALEIDSWNPDFTDAHTFLVAPLYRLPTQKLVGTLTGSWVAAILTSYRVVAAPVSDLYSAPAITPPDIPTADAGTITDARGLLTPPPSPPVPTTFNAGTHNSSLASRISARFPDDIIPVEYAVRRRVSSRKASISSKSTLTTPRAPPSNLEVSASGRTASHRVSSRRASLVDKAPPPLSPKRPVSKPQRSSCLMWIFRVVFKCLFASVRVFLRVAFNVRIALSWGVGLVIRGPGFAWGLLWGAAARPRQLFAPSMSRLAEERPYRQRSLSSSEMSSSRGDIELVASGNSSPSNSDTILPNDRGLSSRAYSVDHARSTYQEGTGNLDAEEQSNAPLSSRESTDSTYPNEGETSSAAEYSDSDGTSVHARETVVAQPVIPDHHTTGPSSSPIKSSSGTPSATHFQSEVERSKELHVSDGGFFAEITPLCSNGSETIEIALLALAQPSEGKTSERDAQTACDATKPPRSDLDTVLLEGAVNFIPSHRSGPSGLSVIQPKDANAPADIRPVRVYVGGPSCSKTPDISTAADASILHLSDPDHKKPSDILVPRQEALDDQHTASGFILRYHVPPETLDREAGTVMVAVRPPEPDSGRL